MKKISIIIFLLTLFSTLNSPAQNFTTAKKIRTQVDTIGFASNSDKMDEFMRRVTSQQGDYIQKTLNDANITDSTVWKAVICPHDDYTYVGYLYPALLSHIKAKTIILIGVCHVAKKFGMENKIIFDSFTHWHMPYGDVPVSTFRDSLIKVLPIEDYVINDSVQQAEHSVEAIIPFLQYYNRDIEIISILVPYMSFERMNEISGPLRIAINKVMSGNNLKWGEDFAIVISNDAVHYGDKDWGDRNFAFYGSDTAGYNKAVEHEMEIINNCLVGKINPKRIQMFNGYTVKDSDYKDYKWTWCGRYSVPFGLSTLYYLSSVAYLDLTGTYVKYATSIDHPHISVDDIGMGITAPANLHHWVGYVAIGYR